MTRILFALALILIGWSLAHSAHAASTYDQPSSQLGQASLRESVRFVTCPSFVPCIASMTRNLAVLTELADRMGSRIRAGSADRTCATSVATRFIAAVHRLQRTNRAYIASAGSNSAHDAVVAANLAIGNLFLGIARHC